MTVSTSARMDALFDLLTSRLTADGQEPRDAGTLLGARVIRASHRGRPGRFDIYILPSGGWTHSASRVKFLHDAGAFEVSR